VDGGGGGGDGDGNGDGNDGVTGIQLSIRRISPAALRRFGVRPTQAAYLYRCLAGFSAGFHDAVAGAYTRPLFSSTRALSHTKNTLHTP